MPSVKRSSRCCGRPPARAGSAMTNSRSGRHERCRPRPTASCTRRSTTSRGIAVARTAACRKPTEVAGWTAKAIRNEPWLLVFMLPVLVITLTLAAISDDGLVRLHRRRAGAGTRPSPHGATSAAAVQAIWPAGRAYAAGSPAPAGAGSDARRAGSDRAEAVIPGRPAAKPLLVPQRPADALRVPPRSSAFRARDRRYDARGRLSGFPSAGAPGMLNNA